MLEAHRMNGQRSLAEDAIPNPIARIEEHIPQLRNFARSLARGDQDRADDLLQDSLVRALSGWRGRRCNGNLRAWLYTIVYNGFVTDQRRRRLRQICCPSLTEVVENDLPGVDGGQETLLAYRDLRRGLADLPDDQRVVLLLISVEDFSYEEAARILGVPIGTVMSRLSRGRERLRQYMNGNWVQTRSLRPKRQRLSSNSRRPVICRV
jgi:RNA polymerase sigma-70 factor, ECF subfamily